jgi:uncharacterized cupredoxin-like copper-binding protein
MKIIVAMILAGAISIGIAQGQETVKEKTAEAWDKTKETAKDAGRAVVKGTKKAVDVVADALTPDPDASRVDVKLTEHHIDMPKSVSPGKTAFVVKNAGEEKHNFEIRGKGTDQKFLVALTPDQTKVLHVNLKRGTYKVYCPLDRHEEKGMEFNLTVR